MSKHKVKRNKRQLNPAKGFARKLTVVSVNLDLAASILEYRKGMSNAEAYQDLRFEIYVSDSAGHQILVPAKFSCFEEDGAIAALFGYVNNHPQASKKEIDEAIEAGSDFVNEAIRDFVVRTAGIGHCPECGCCLEHCDCDRSNSQNTLFLPRPLATTSTFDFFVLNPQLIDALVYQVQVFEDKYSLSAVEEIIVVARSGSPVSYAQMEAAMTQMAKIRVDHHDFYGSWEETVQGQQLVAAIEAVGAAVSAAIEDDERKAGMYGPDESPSEDFRLVSANLDLGKED